MKHRSALHGLYAITPDGRPLPQLLVDVDAVLSGGARLLQYRNKLAPAAVRETEATALLDMCLRHGVPLIINDDSALAARIGAHGVHLGRDDGGVDAARALLGAQALIGASCYDSLEQAEAAVAAGADYVAFGSVFSSTSKPQAPRAPLALLRRAAERVPVPVCAIGGITRSNAAEVIASGATMLAVIGDLFDAPDPRAAAAAYRDLL
jgi:thiamine-phosphate pyrophosphorylase